MTVRAMKAGAVEFLTKPFRDEDLLNAVDRAIKCGHKHELIRTAVRSAANHRRARRH